MAEAIKDLAIKITADTTQLEKNTKKSVLILQKVSNKVIGIFSGVDKQVKRARITVDNNLKMIAKSIEKDFAAQVKGTEKAIKDQVSKTKMGANEKIKVAQNTTKKLVDEAQKVNKKINDVRKQQNKGAKEFEFKFDLDGVEDDLNDMSSLIRDFRTNDQSFNRQFQDANRKIREAGARGDLDGVEKGFKNIEKASQEAARKRQDSARSQRDKGLISAKEFNKRMLAIEKDQSKRLSRIRRTRQAEFNRIQQGGQQRQTGQIVGGRIFSNTAEQARGLTASLGPLGNVLGKLGPVGLIAGAGIFAVTKVFGAASKAAAEFQDVGLKVETLLSTDQAKALPAAMEKLKQTSVETGEPIKELGKSLFNIISGAPKLAGNMDAANSILEKTTKTAIGLGASSDATSLAFVSLANSTGLSIENAKDQDKVFGILAKTMKEGLIPSGENLASAISKSAPAVAALTNNGNEAVSAIGAMTASLTTSGRSADEAQTEIKALFGALGDFNKRTKLVSLGLRGIDAETGKIDNLSEVINSASENMNKMSATLGSKQAINAIRTLGKEGGVVFKDQLQTFMNETGETAETMFETMQKSNASANKRMKASFNSLLVTVGGDMSNLSTSVQNSVAGVVSFFDDLFKTSETKAGEAIAKFNEFKDVNQDLTSTLDILGSSLNQVGEDGKLTGEQTANAISLANDRMKQVAEFAPFLADEIKLVADSMQDLINNKEAATVDSMKELIGLLKEAEEFSEALALKEATIAASEGVDGLIDKLDDLGGGGFGKTNQAALVFKNNLETIKDTQAEIAELRADSEKNEENAADNLSEINDLIIEQNQARVAIRDAETAVNDIVKQQLTLRAESAKINGEEFNLIQAQNEIRLSVTKKISDSAKGLADAFIEQSGLQDSINNAVIQQGNAIQNNVILKQNEKDINTALQEIQLDLASKDETRKAKGEERLLNLQSENDLSKEQVEAQRQILQSQLAVDNFNKATLETKVEIFQNTKDSFDLNKKTAVLVDSQIKSAKAELKAQERRVNTTERQLNQLKNIDNVQSKLIKDAIKGAGLTEKKAAIELENNKQRLAFLEASTQKLTEAEKVELKTLQTTIQKVNEEKVLASIQKNKKDNLISEANIQKSIEQELKKQLITEKSTNAERITGLNKIIEQNNIKINLITQEAILMGSITQEQINQISALESQNRKLEKNLADSNKIVNAESLLGVKLDENIDKEEKLKDLTESKLDLKQLELQLALERGEIDQVGFEEASLGIIGERLQKEKELLAELKKQGGSEADILNQRKKVLQLDIQISKQRKKIGETTKAVADKGEKETKTKATTKRDKTISKATKDFSSDIKKFAEDRKKIEEQFNNVVFQQAESRREINAARKKAEKKFIDSIIAFRDSFLARNKEFAESASKGIKAALNPFKTAAELIIDKIKGVGKKFEDFQDQLVQERKKEFETLETQLDENKKTSIEARKVFRKIIFEAKGLPTSLGNALVKIQKNVDTFELGGQEVENRESVIKSLEDAANLLKKAGGDTKELLKAQRDVITQEKFIQKLIKIRAEQQKPGKLGKPQLLGQPKFVSEVNIRSSQRELKRLQDRTVKINKQNEQALGLSDKLVGSFTGLIKDFNVTSKAVEGTLTKINDTAIQLGSAEKLSIVEAQELFDKQAESAKAQAAARADLLEKQPETLKTLNNIEKIAVALRETTNRAKQIAKIQADAFSADNVEDFNKGIAEANKEADELFNKLKKDGFDLQTIINDLEEFDPAKLKELREKGLISEDQAKDISLVRNVLTDITQESKEQLEINKKIVPEMRKRIKLQKELAEIGLDIKKINADNAKGKNDELDALNKIEKKQKDQLQTLNDSEFNLKIQLANEKATLRNLAEGTEEHEKQKGIISGIKSDLKEINGKEGTREKLLENQNKELKTASKGIIKQGFELENILETGKGIALFTKAIGTAFQEGETASGIEGIGILMAKTADIAEDSVARIQDVAKTISSGDKVAIADQITDVTKQIGQALLKAPPPFSVIGAVMLAAGVIGGIITKVVGALKGAEKTSLDIAEDRAFVHEQQLNILKRQVETMDELADSGDRAVDQAKEQLEILKQTLINAQAHNKFARLNTKQLIKQKNLTKDNIAESDKRLKQAQDLLEFGTKKQRKSFIEGLGIKVGARDTKDIVENMIIGIEGDLVEFATDLEDIEFFTGLNEDIRDAVNQAAEELARLNRIRLELFQEDLEIPLGVIQSQFAKIFDPVRDNLLGVLNDLGLGIDEFISDEDLKDRLQEFLKLDIFSTEDLDLVENFLDLLEEGDQLAEDFNALRKQNNDDQLKSFQDQIKLIRAREKVAALSSDNEQDRIDIKNQADEDVIEQLEMQLDFLNSIGAAEIDILDIQAQILELKQKENEAESKSNKALVEAVRLRQQQLELFRKAAAGGQITTEQQIQLQDSENAIRSQLKKSGASDEEIEAFIKELPAFSKGGVVPKSGLGLLTEGELVIPKNQTKEVAEQIDILSSLLGKEKQSFVNPIAAGTDNLTKTIISDILQKEAMILNQQINVRSGDVIIQALQGEDTQDLLRRFQAIQEESTFNAVNKGLEQNKIDIRQGTGI